MNDEYVGLLNYRGLKNCLIITSEQDIGEAYDWLTSSKRDILWGAISGDNWRFLVLMPGKYEPLLEVYIDTDFTGIVSFTTDFNSTIVEGTFGGGGPPNQKGVFNQSADTIVLSGFTIRNLQTTGAGHGLHLRAADNSKSFYTFMQFISQPDPSGAGRCGVQTSGTSDFKGTWIHCYGNPDTTHGFRILGTGDWDPDMYFCVAGDKSYMGSHDWMSGSGKGRHRGCRGGDLCFGYDLEFPVITTDSYYWDCVAGDGSYGPNSLCNGNYFSCIGGDNCWGGDNGAAHPGLFGGYAENCVATGKSFCDTKCTGEIVNCRILNRSTALICEGATIRNSRVIVTTNNIDGLSLIDGNTKVYNTDIIVNQGGTGIPINDDGNPRNVVAAHCRMNNASNDADGLGANVTNLVAGNNVVDDDIS